jgi:hypothetical protein
MGRYVTSDEIVRSRAKISTIYPPAVNKLWTGRQQRPPRTEGARRSRRCHRSPEVLGCPPPRGLAVGGWNSTPRASTSCASELLNLFSGSLDGRRHSHPGLGDRRVAFDLFGEHPGTGASYDKGSLTS